MFSCSVSAKKFSADAARCSCSADVSVITCVAINFHLTIFKDIQALLQKQIDIFIQAFKGPYFAQEELNNVIVLMYLALRFKVVNVRVIGSRACTSLLFLRARTQYISK